MPQKPLYVQVADRIEALIKNGELTPTDQLLPERELAETFEVSRTSIRNALAFLHGKGIIEVNPRDGAYVRQQNMEDAMQLLKQALYQKRKQVAFIFEVRQIIETQTACLAAERRTAADIHYLQNLNHQFEAGLSRGDLAFEANTRFHLGIVQTAKNPLLIEIMTTMLTAMMQIYETDRHQGLLQATNLTQFVEEHERIINAIAQQNTELATALVTKHITDARKRVESIMEGD